MQIFLDLTQQMAQNKQLQIPMVKLLLGKICLENDHI